MSFTQFLLSQPEFKAMLLSIIVYGLLIVVLTYIEIKILKYLIKFGIDYFYTKKREERY